MTTEILLLGERARKIATLRNRRLLSDEWKNFSSIIIATNRFNLGKISLQTYLCDTGEYSCFISNQLSTINHKNVQILKGQHFMLGGSQLTVCDNDFQPMLLVRRLGESKPTLNRLLPLQIQ